MDIFMILGSGISVLLGMLVWNVSHFYGYEEGFKKGLNAGITEYMKKELIESKTLSGTYIPKHLTQAKLDEIRKMLIDNVNKD